MDTSYTMTVEESPEPSGVQFVRAQLTVFNRAQAADDRFQPLVILVRDAGGQIVGGLVGGTYWGWLYTEVLWVEEGLRGEGCGQSLLAAAEAEAVRRGCRYAHLDTMSFQALPFYQKQYTIRLQSATPDIPYRARPCAKTPQTTSGGLSG